MADDTKYERTKKLREALKKGAGKPPMAAAATGPETPKALETPKAVFKKKNNHRTAKARDLRAKMRGRLPSSVAVNGLWDGGRWEGNMVIFNTNEERALSTEIIKTFQHQADGLFRLMEEMDCMFWEWFAKEATKEEKERLTFAPDPPVPAPWPTPEAAAGTAPGSH